jgi:DHA1 family multidrug resistance protein-like MFS transporter
LTSSSVSPGPWKKSLYTLLLAELLVMVGFSFVFPFMPLYIEKLGHFTTQQAAFWAGIAEGASGLGMFVFSPLWGIMADRSGRKPMVLRAMFGAAIVVGLIGISPNVPFLISMRFIQGALTGTIAAASALIASITPRDKMPLAMGLLMTMVYTGNSAGPLLGGLAADKFGNEATFFITSGILVIGGLIVLLLVQEKYERPVFTSGNSWQRIFTLIRSKQMLALLVIQFTLQAGPNMVAPIISLLMQQLNPSGAAATSTGIAMALSSVIAAVTATVVGRLAGRIPLKTILVYSCLGTCLVYLPPLTVGTVTQLTVYIALRGLVNGGIMTSSYAIISLSIPPDQQGTAFGVVQSANSLGNGLGPIVGGFLGSTLGLKNVFAFTSGMYLLAGLLVIKALPRRPAEKA